MNPATSIAAPVHAGSTPKTALKTCEAAPSDARGALLVVAPGGSLRSRLEGALEEAGYEVESAESGADAVAAAARRGPELAVIELSEALRTDVIAELKADHGAALGCVAVGASGRAELGIAAFDAGADDFVTDAAPPAELVRRIAAVDRMRRAYAEALRANEAADRLRLFASETAALLAHDLNNGLSVVSANLGFVGEHVDEGGEVDEALGSSRRALKRMIALVRNFVDIARFEDAALEPTPTRVDVSELVRGSAAIHDPRKSGARVDIECPEGLTTSIDPVLVERILHNLLTNATRYVDAGGVVRVSARRAVDRGLGPRLEIAVGNTGGPIPPQQRAGLFEKYRTGPDGRAQRGMGLYFCRLAAEAMGGSIELSEHSPFPTDFVVVIPITGE